MEYPDYYIVTADDDIFYPKDWLEKIWEVHEEYPDEVIASRIRRITFEDEEINGYDDWILLNETCEASYLNFPTNGAGKLFLPNMFSDKIFDEELFLKLCPLGDDIWFWAMMLIHNYRIRPIEKPFNILKYVNIAREVGIIGEYKLWDETKDRCNDIQINNVINKFPEILTMLHKENEND